MQTAANEIERMLSKGEVKKAEIRLAQIMRTEVSNHEISELLLLKARVKLSAGNPDEATEALKTAVEHRSEVLQSSAFQELMGDCYFAHFEQASLGFADRNDLLRARSVYVSILQQNPDYLNRGWLYYQLGRIAIALDQSHLAESLFQQALLSPNTISSVTAFCYERLGFIAFYEKGLTAEALAYLRQAVDTYPRAASQRWLVQVNILQGRIFKHLHDFSSSMRCLDTALDIASENVDIDRATLAEALLAKAEVLSDFGGNEKDVLGYLHQFLQVAKKPVGVDVTWSRVSEMMGNIYFRLGNIEEGMASLEAALRYNPDHPWATSVCLQIARGAYQLKEYRSVIKILDQIPDARNHPDFRVYELLGNAYFALREYAASVEAYDNALEHAPTEDAIQSIRQYRELAASYL
jgi:tetratricopeptide (TPR) repeat protein